jgi:hypothetical protein
VIYQMVEALKEFDLVYGDIIREKKKIEDK